MSDRPVEELTLRDQCSSMDRLLAEFNEHLERGFVPKVNSLIKLVKPSPDGPRSGITDRTVRTHVSQVLTTEDFTNELFKKITHFGETIDKEVAGLIGQDSLD